VVQDESIFAAFLINTYPQAASISQEPLTGLKQ
jgi:hypothetical protein